jgi:hypothetical protein
LAQDRSFEEERVMKKIVAVLGFLAVSSPAFAINDHQVDANAFKAVADAVVSESKIADDQTIHSITRINDQAFAIQLKNEEGACVQIVARVVVAPAGPATKFLVGFSRIAPLAVKCD